MLLFAGVHLNVYLYAGSKCWDRAKLRREAHGAGSALVLPDGVDPVSLRWPAVDSMVVCWPPSAEMEYRRKLDLARALMRDGVRFAAIEHRPKCLHVWRHDGLPS